MDERAYEAGMRRALINLLHYVLRELGIEDPEAGKTQWAAERLEVAEKLREVCAAHGDNDWSDELNLGDVIEKHLWRYLGEG